MRDEPTNLVITGAGGQGNVLAAQWLGLALVRAGFQVTVGDTYGLSQRGGSVMSHLRISREKRYGPLIPAGRAHVVMGLEPVETLRVLAEYGNPQVTVLTNNRAIYPQGVIAGDADYPAPDRLRAALEELSARLIWIPATEIAQNLGSAIAANVVLLGALFGAGLAPFDRKIMLEVLEEHVPGDKWDVNRSAFEKGFDAARDESRI